MTAADAQLINVPGLMHAEQAALDVLVATWRAKRQRNNLRTALYDMKNATSHLMSPEVPAVIRARSFVLGWSAIAVDKLNRRCNVDGFYAPDGTDLDGLGLDDLVRENRLMSELSQTGVSSLLHGCAFLVTARGDVQAGEPEVLVMGKTATSAAATWDRRRRAVSSFLSVNAFDENGEPSSMVLYLPGSMVIIERAGWRWSVTRSTAPITDAVPVDVLSYRPRLDRPFGQSRISRAVMSIHEQALAAMMRADVNGEAYSLPRYVLLGATEEALSPKNSDGTIRPRWSAAWASIWGLPDAEEAANPRADVKQFTGQSPEPQNAHLRMLAQMLSGETGIPIGELGIIGDANPTSYEAMQASRDDIITEAEQTTDTWSPDIASALRRALAMRNGVPLDEAVEVRPVWRNPMHTSRAAAADAGSKIIDKMPSLADTEVGMELLGLSADQIRRVKVEQRRNSGRAILDALRAAPDVGASS